jgi:hypothetical protein
MAEAPDRKPPIWMGRSRKDIQEFPDRVKGELGYGLDLLHIDEEMLVNLSHGRLTELTIEHLFRYLNILGRDLEVVLKPPSTASSQGKLTVTVI